MRDIKTAKMLVDEHVAQILGYLKSARLEHGLLINFGSCLSYFVIFVFFAAKSVNWFRL